MKTTTVAPMDTFFCVLHSVSLQLFVTFLCSTAALSVLLILYIFYFMFIFVYFILLPSALFHQLQLSIKHRPTIQNNIQILLFFSYTYGTFQLHNTWDGVLTENRKIPGPNKE